jgi:HPt (histidine-containing phosphotransfer) domain-containing protein
MIDRTKFNENFQYFDKEVVIEIIDIFVSEYDERFSNLDKNIRERDFDKLKFNAHSLKGVVANFMDPVTIDLTRRLDEAAKYREEKGLDDLYTQLRQASENLLSELKQFRTELTS